MSLQSKAKAKSANLKYQWQIMRSLGLEDEEIALFADPMHWLGYFPQWCMKDLKGMGLRVSTRSRNCSTAECCSVKAECVSYDLLFTVTL